MKKNNISRSFAALLMGCAIFMVSCEPTGPEEEKDPVFPTSVEKTLSPGQTVTLTFDANLDWEVSVPESSLTTFWIEDGAMDVAKVSGKAGSGVSVTVGTTSAEAFDERSCVVTMKMGGQSQQIAKIVLPGKDMSLIVYSAVVEDGEVQYGDGGYLYGNAEAESIDLIWTGTDFRLPIKVAANYSWTVKSPSWAEVDVPEDRVGEVVLNVYGVPSEYPLADASGKLQFMSGETLVKEYDITIPGCEDIFSYSVGMGMTELVFNYAGKVRTAAGFIDEPASVDVTGTSGVRVFAVESAEGKFDLDGTAGPSWLKIEEEEYDDTDGADVLQERTVSIDVETNEGEDRNAVVFFLPPSAPQDRADLFTEGLDAVKEEYAQYTLPVTQLSINQEFVMMLSSASEMAANGAEFNKSEDSSLYTRFGETKYAYELIYTNEYARDYARMVFSSAVSSYKIFNHYGTDKTTDPEFFLSMTIDEDNTVGVIDMVTEAEADGFVVLYGETDNVLAVIKCTFDPSHEIGEVFDVAFIGESAMYAPMAGATLEKVTEGELFDIYVSEGAPIYHLKYTMSGMPMSVSLPLEAKSYMPNPFGYMDYFSVNGIGFYDTDPLGSFERIDGGVQIYMTLPEGETYKRGALYFYNVSNAGAASNEQLVLVLVCTIDLSETAE